MEVVEPGSPAENAGLRGGELELNIGGQSLLLGGDVITEVNGTAVTGPEKRAQVLEPLKVGAKVSLTVVRGDKPRHVEIALTERPLLPWDIPARRTMLPVGTAPRAQRVQSGKSSIWVF